MKHREEYTLELFQMKCGFKGWSGYGRFWNIGAAAFIREFQGSSFGMMRFIVMKIMEL